MSESKHTPGPWKIWEHGGKDDPSCKIFAELSGLKELSVGIAQTIGGNDEANARLIAAAPELLAELKRLQESFGWDETHPASKIIAKAEKG